MLLANASINKVVVITTHFVLLIVKISNKINKTIIPAIILSTLILVSRSQDKNQKVQINKETFEKLAVKSGLSSVGNYVTPRQVFV